jgi:hypothetical protein
MTKRLSYVQMKQAMVASLRHIAQGVRNPFADLAERYYSRGKGGKHAHTFTGVRKAQRAAAKRRNIAKRGRC